MCQIQSGPVAAWFSQAALDKAFSASMLRTRTRVIK